MRLAADVGYGLAFRNRGSMTPYAGMQSSAWGRDWRAGVAWKLDRRLDLGLEATRRESADGAENDFLLRGAWRFGPAPSRGAGVEPGAFRQTEEGGSAVGGPQRIRAEDAERDCAPGV